MRHITLLKHSIALACLAAGLVPAARAQDDSTVDKAVVAKQAAEIRQGDPARWYRNDPRMKTLQKEIGAAYEEAKNACRKGPAGERSSCLKEARATYDQDMKNAPNQLEQAPKASVTETITKQ